MSGFVLPKFPDAVPVSRWIVLGMSVLLAAATSTAGAQLQGPEGVYQPLHQNMPPGTAGYWSGALGKADAGYLQPVRLELPSRGTVTVYEGPSGRSQTAAAPALVGLGVSYTYRLRIGDMPEFPGVELYPTVEVLDRLHAPSRREADFPVPVPIEGEEIERVLGGRMLTKVIFLEQPDLADPRPQQQPLRTHTLPAERNLLAEADLVGRPMLILRMGGRVPSGTQPDPQFFGRGAPFEILEIPQSSQRNGSGRAAARISQKRNNPFLQAGCAPDADRDGDWEDSSAGDDARPASVIDVPVQSEPASRRSDGLPEIRYGGAASTGFLTR